MFYQPGKDHTVGRISEKDVQFFLCLVITILNFERELKKMLYVIKMLYINLYEKQEDREFNRTKMKLSPKNFTHDSSQRNLEYNPHGLTAENVWKAIRKKIYAVFYNVKRTVTCEC